MCISIIFPAYWYTNLNIHFLLSKNIYPYNISIRSIRTATRDSSITKATRDIVGSAPFALNTNIETILLGVQERAYRLSAPPVALERIRQPLVLVSQTLVRDV